MADLYFVPEKGHQLLKLCDYLIVSEKVGSYFKRGDDWHVALSRLGQTGSRFVGISLGEKGMIYRFQEQNFAVPAFDVQIADTAGAGDALHGAFAFALAMGWSVHDAAQFGVAVGSLNCQSIGPQTALPSLEEATKFLRKHHFRGPWDNLFVD